MRARNRQTPHYLRLGLAACGVLLGACQTTQSSESSEVEPGATPAADVEEQAADAPAPVEPASTDAPAAEEPAPTVAPAPVEPAHAEEPAAKEAAPPLEFPREPYYHPDSKTHIEDIEKHLKPLKAIPTGEDEQGGDLS